MLKAWESAPIFVFDTWEASLDKIVNKFEGLSSTDCNFQGLLRPWFFILIFKDFQGLSRRVRTLIVIDNRMNSPSESLLETTWQIVQTRLGDKSAEFVSCFPILYEKSSKDKEKKNEDGRMSYNMGWNLQLKLTNQADWKL